MKVIDLLNKIANGEEVPKRIKHYQTYYTWYDNGYSKGYCKEPVKADGNSFLEIDTYFDINKEVEIIEDKEDINIQDIEEMPNILLNTEDPTEHIIEQHNKINEIIRAVKHLEKTKEDK